MTRLQHLHVQGFTSIQTLDLEVGDINVFVGPNGSGKSNFLRLFRLLRAVARGNLQLFLQKSGRASSLLYYGPKATKRIEVGVSFDDTEYAFRLVYTEDERLVFEWESPTSPPDGDRLRTGGHEEAHLYTDATNASDGALSSVQSTLSSWRVYHFADSTLTAPPKQSCNLHDNEHLHADAGNVAAFLYLMRDQHEANYRMIRRAVQRIFPRFEDFALRPNPHNEDKIRLEWREKGSDYRFQPHQLSDGTLRFICLATLLLQPDLPTTVIVDEPELGLHPRALGVLAGLVRSAASRSQVIMTTQSVTLLDQFEPEDIVVIDREEDTDDGVAGETRSKSVFRRLEDQEDLESWLEDYTIGELWEMNMIGGRP
jgi:predicted ATPase